MSEEKKKVGKTEALARPATEGNELLMLDDKDLENLKSWAKQAHGDETASTVELMVASAKAESTIVDGALDKEEMDATDELDKEVEEIMSEPVPSIDEDEAFIEKVKSVKKDDPDWANMKRRGTRSLGRDYLLSSLTHLPSIPGTPVGRGRKAAKASKLRAMKMKDKPQLTPVPRECREDLVNNNSKGKEKPTPGPEKMVTRTSQTSPYMSVDQLKKAMIDKVENEKTVEIERLSTKLRGREAEIIEARLKNDYDKLRELENQKDGELGKIAAKAIKAERIKRILRGNDDDEVYNFTWFIDRRAGNGEDAVWWSKHDDQGIAQVNLGRDESDEEGLSEEVKERKKRLSQGKADPADEFELTEVAKEKILTEVYKGKDMKTAQPAIVGEAVDEQEADSDMNEAGPSTSKRARTEHETEDDSEIDVSDVIDLEELHKQKPKKASKAKKAKKWKRPLPKLEGETKTNYHLWLNDIMKAERKNLKYVIEGQPMGASDVIEDIPGNIKAGPIYNSIANWRYEAYKRQYRPMSSRFIDLITMSADDVENLDYHDRVNYKLGVYQLLNNINFVSARYQLSDIRGKIPTSRIKNLLAKFYH